MGGLTYGSNMRRSGLSLRVVAAVITMVLLVACSAVTCLAGMHAGEGVDARSQSHAIASADHLPHEHAFDTPAPDLVSSERPARPGSDTTNFHLDPAESVPAGAEGCAHNIYDPRDGTPVRSAAPDALIVPAASGGLVRDSYGQGRLAGVQDAVPVGLSLVQLSISPSQPVHPVMVQYVASAVVLITYQESGNA